MPISTLLLQQPSLSLTEHAAPAQAQSEPELAHQQAQQLAQQQQEELAALLAAQGGPPGGWDTLPPLLLDRIFNLLDPKSLAAAASVCSTWRYEVSGSRVQRKWQEGRKAIPIRPRAWRSQAACQGGRRAVRWASRFDVAPKLLA